MNSESVDRAGYIAIVGKPNVGKSTLLNHLVGQKISITSGKAQTTRHRITGILTEENSQFIFVDTPGFQTQYSSALSQVMNRSVTQSLADIDIVLFVVEAKRFNERDRQVVRLLPADRPVFLVINKIDKLEHKNELLPFIEEVAREFSFAGIVPVCAQHGRQLPELLDAIRSYLPENPAIFSADEVTNHNERFLAAEMIREKLFRLLGDELPYAMSVMIEQFKMDGAMRRISAVIIVDKPGQKAIVIGNKGEKLKTIATQARLDMEKLFDGKVFLEVWVKVKGGWADDERTLRTLGYE